MLRYTSHLQPHLTMLSEEQVQEMIRRELFQESGDISGTHHTQDILLFRE